MLTAKFLLVVLAKFCNFRASKELEEGIVVMDTWDKFCDTLETKKVNLFASCVTCTAFLIVRCMFVDLFIKDTLTRSMYTISSIKTCLEDELIYCMLTPHTV